MTYDEIIKSMPAGLERAVLTVLKDRIGREHAIKKGELVATVGKLGFCASERQIRLAIANLRKQGNLIGSTNQDGYFIIRDLSEWQYVKDSEFSPRIKDLAETVRILDQAAREAFGDGYQVSLF